MVCRVHPNMSCWGRGSTTKIAINKASRLPTSLVCYRFVSKINDNLPKILNTHYFSNSAGNETEALIFQELQHLHNLQPLAELLPCLGWVAVYWRSKTWLWKISCNICITWVLGALMWDGRVFKWRHSGSAERWKYSPNWSSALIYPCELYREEVALVLTATLVLNWQWRGILQ